MRIASLIKVGTVSALGASFVLAWGGCTADKTTELVPGVTSQIRVPRNLRTIRVDVQAEGSKGTCITKSVDPLTGGVTLPRTLGVLPEADRNRLVTVTVTGYTAEDGTIPPLQDCATAPALSGKYDPNVKVLRRSRQRYVDGRILFIPMPLKYSCYEAKECPDNETCKAGACVPAEVDPNSLPDFRPDLVEGTTNTCFSPKACFTPSIKAQVVNAVDCTFTYPAPPAPQFPADLKGANVRVFYDHAEAEFLDLDRTEGFEFPNPTDTRTIKLAPGLCALYKNGLAGGPGRQIVEVQMSPACPAKTAYQPICESEKDKPGPLPDGGDSKDGFCNINFNMPPSPSALYIVMSDSDSMRPVYSGASVRQVLNFSLADPAFRNTKIAFRRMSHDNGQCAINAPTLTADATPEIDFKAAPEAKPLIAAKIGDATLVRGNDPPMLVNALLKGNGVYHPVREIDKTTPYNRRAVLLIGNRPFTNDCAGATAATLAASALTNDNVNTYVVALANTATANYSITEANAIAAAGGTSSAFDVRTNPQNGVNAFNKVVQDLASCLYEKPAGIDQTAVVSFANPLTGAETKLTFDATCNNATRDTANGWNIESGTRVRLCGTACNDLRAAIATSWAIAAQDPNNLKQIQEVPVRAMQLCK